MNNNGQIFSVDFLIAIILMIFFLGTIIGMTEVKNYEKKEELSIYTLENQSDAAVIVLTNSNLFACKTDTNNVLAYSIDMQKINTFAGNSTELKEKLGLLDYNISIKVGNITVFSEDLSENRNVHVSQINVLKCNNGILFSDLNACMTGLCTDTITQEILLLEVGK
jgi:hypothetical protein